MRDMISGICSVLHSSHLFAPSPPRPNEARRLLHHNSRRNRRRSIKPKSRRSTRWSQVCAPARPTKTSSPMWMSSRKAGKWLLEFPQDFANAQSITNYLAVLDQGIERGHLLQKGQSPWVTEKGRKVLGYYSPLDGSVQPMGVTIPDSYDATKPDRLYVWLHGRSNALTEASFINGFKNAPQFPNTAYTADVGQFTLDCYGRGNNANHQAGEVDIFEGIAAMQRRFKIDPERILLRGFSLGGAAAWHIALQYPDRWAAAEVGRGHVSGTAGVCRDAVSAVSEWAAAHLRKHHRLGAERIQSSARGA